MSYEPLSILLIDDSYVTCNLFELICEYHGVPLAVIADAESAFNYLERTTPEVIVVDLFLDGTDGWAILKHLREMGFTGPVAATTYFHSSRVLGRALIDGFDAYLPKPIDVRNLVPYLWELWKVHSASDPDQTSPST